MTVVELLKAAKKRIKDPTRWTSGVYARDANNRSVPYCDKRAKCWCAYGSILAENNGELAEKAYYFLMESVSDPEYQTPVWVNDCLGHAEVMSMFDRAIALAESAQ